MRKLNAVEVTAVEGGAVVALWTILIFGYEELNDLGRGIGAGIYDATH